MRKITIHQNGGSPIEITDDSEVQMSQYCGDISRLMKMANVAILETSSASVVLRPSQITGIKVEDEKSFKETFIPVTEADPPKEEQPKKEEDIITDVDV